MLEEVINFYRHFWLLHAVSINEKCNVTVRRPSVRPSVCKRTQKFHKINAHDFYDAANNNDVIDT